MQLKREERLRRLRQTLSRLSGDSGLNGMVETLQSSIGDSGTESLDVGGGGDDEFALEVLDGLSKEGIDSEIDETQQEALEAIVHKRYRPAIYIKNNSFVAPASGPWKILAEQANRSRIETAIPSIGRIEIPNDPMGRPYAGTGFIVGENILMTNRHVAEIFSNGIGTASIEFKAGQTVGVDFLREHDSTENRFFDVEKVLMIHPFWDMALLKVRGLEGQTPLSLHVSDPEELKDQDVATIGYPAQDMRNDLFLQNRIFKGVFDVKRLQPGKLISTRQFPSFGNEVVAATHDCSTLGGNSGSAIVHLKTGGVVALHFAGKYLEANYAVPMSALAADSEIVDLGLNFDGEVAKSDVYPSVWKNLRSSRANEERTGSTKRITIPTTLQCVANENGVDVPLTLTIKVGSSRFSQIDSEGMVNSLPAEEPVAGFFLGSLEERQFSWRAALSTALASKLSYDSQDHVVKVCGASWGFETTKVIVGGNTHCFVATNGKTGLVAFRGTNQLSDWLTNLKISGTQTEYGTVHSGFLGAFSDVREQINAVLKEKEIHRVVITGHSLGGAIATIAAAEWRTEFSDRSVYTFGQPAVGNGDFVGTIQEAYGGSFSRFVNDDDIVPKVPPNFSHVGKLYHLDSNGVIQAMESAFQKTTFNEEEFKKLKEQLSEEMSGRESFNRSSYQEGIFPSVRDHSMDEYIRKINKNLD